MKWLYVSAGVLFSFSFSRSLRHHSSVSPTMLLLFLFHWFVWEIQIQFFLFCENEMVFSDIFFLSFAFPTIQPTPLFNRIRKCSFFLFPPNSTKANRLRVNDVTSLCMCVRACLECLDVHVTQVECIINSDNCTNAIIPILSRNSRSLAIRINASSRYLPPSHTCWSKCTRYEHLSLQRIKIIGLIRGRMFQTKKKLPPTTDMSDSNRNHTHKKLTQNECNCISILFFKR